LDRLIDDEDAALVILDPLLSRLDGKLDSHVNAKVRQGLEPLGLWVETRHVAILGLIHPNKNTTGDLLTSLTGSRAFAEVARAVLVLLADPDDPTRRLLGQLKNNLGLADQPTLAFTIVSESIEEDITTAKIMLLPDDPRSPDEIWEQVKAAGRATPGSAPTKGAEAAEWVKKYLTAHGGEAPVADLIAAGDLRGYSRSLLNDAKVKLALDHPKRGTWSLPTVALVGAPQVPTNPTSPTSPTSLEAPPSNAVSTQTKETKQ